MSVEERVHAVIRALYDAALDETRWPEALRELTDLTGSQAATFWVLDRSEKPRLPTLTTLNFDPRFMEAYLDGMVPLDPTVQYLVNHPEEPIVHDGLVIAEREKDRHPYYDWHGQHSDTRFRMVGQVRPAAEVQAGVALHRAHTVGRYEPRDIQRFAILYEHLKRALSIGFRLGSLGAMQQSAMELLDRNPAAVVLLDDRKHVIYANDAAEEFHSSSGEIKLSPDGVTLPRKHDNDRLQTLIAHALAGITSPGGFSGGSMRALRPSGKRPYLILISPVSRQYPVLSTLRPAVYIIITDPDRQKPIARHLLRSAFGLTDAEARLAVLLASGEGLRSSAERLGITYGTARVRLAEIFQKTETSRQGELIALLLTTLAIR